MREFFTKTESDKQNNLRSPANPPDVTVPNWVASEGAFLTEKISNERETDKIDRNDGGHRRPQNIQRRLLLKRSQASAISAEPYSSRWRPAA